VKVEAYGGTVAIDDLLCLASVPFAGWHKERNDHPPLNDRRLPGIPPASGLRAQYWNAAPQYARYTTAEGRAARPLYEEDYCGRGDMENRIKEQQLWLFADRLSTETLRANQLRLYFASVAYVLLEGLRRLGLPETPLAQAQCGTIRQHLLKIGALVRVTVRKVWVSLSSAYPLQEVFARVWEKLQRMVPAGTSEPLGEGVT